MIMTQEMEPRCAKHTPLFSYSTIDEQLPVQVETGEGPDMARITNFGAYRGKYSIFALI